VLVNGRSLAIPKIARHAPAILEAWYPGQEGGHAIADILLGKVSPSGKLPSSIPHSAGQLPVHCARRPRMGWYIDAPSEPLYPFGHGLSYTTFEYSAPTATREGVTVRLTNAGTREGTEVVQLYLEPATCSFSTPLKRLVAYRRVTLAPGASAALTFPITDKDLYQLDQDLEPRMVRTQWKVHAGGSSASGVTGNLDMT
jgi:beta-glucosidase